MTCRSDSNKWRQVFSNRTRAKHTTINLFFQTVKLMKNSSIHPLPIICSGFSHYYHFVREDCQNVVGCVGFLGNRPLFWIILLNTPAQRRLYGSSKGQSTYKRLNVHWFYIIQTSSVCVILRTHVYDWEHYVSSRHIWGFCRKVLEKFTILDRSYKLLLKWKLTCQI